MTIKQAVDALKNLAFLSTDKEHEECEKAIQMAIKALEEIEEYRVKEFQCHLAHEEGVSVGYAKAIDECIKIIEETVWKDTDMLVESIRELKGGAIDG